MLSDKNGICLSIKGTERLVKLADENKIVPGMSFSEEYAGTNAIELSLKHEKSVYILSEQHYCNFMRKWSCYAVDLSSMGKVFGCLALFIDGKSIKREQMAISELLAYRIVSELMKEQNVPDVNVKKQDIHLTDRQFEIIRFLEKGLTDKSIANEMKLSVSTIKYHKSKLFKKLNVGCSLEAVIEAYKLKILTIE